MFLIILWATSHLVGITQAPSPLLVALQHTALPRPYEQQEALLP